MYGTNTITGTYTVIDVRKTFEGFEADIRTIARRTGKWTMSYVDDLFHDIIELAENGYLDTVTITLNNSNTGTAIRAVKFTVNSNGTATSSERAGSNNDWEDLCNTNLSVILSYTSKWHNLSESAKSNFQKSHSFKIGWVSSSVNTNFPHLNSNNAQLYASKGYELQKTNFK
ncbi:MAG: hypothetical protein R2805_03080 [Flavobacterium sp.]|jgi:hypothetical protein|uniref:HORMA-1 domain-containing protein n=1 Tax=Flavobacterium sp. TaxID=239 RepID=UPI00352828DF